MSIPRLVYGFDDGYAEPSVLSAFTAALYASEPIDVAFLALDNVDKVQVYCDLLEHRFPGSAFRVEKAARPEVGLINNNRFGDASNIRLTLHETMDGRVIYVDGDTMFLRDVATLYRTELAGHPLAACLDSVALRDHYSSLRKRISPKKLRGYLAARRAILPELDFSRYFNSGLLLMDLDRLKQHPLAPMITQPVKPERFDFHDQDWLNILFRDEIYLLDPVWNSLWGNCRIERAYVPEQVRRQFHNSQTNPAMIHFASDEKPWKSARPNFRGKYLFRLAELRERQRIWDLYHHHVALFRTEVSPDIFSK